MYNAKRYLPAGTKVDVAAPDPKFAAVLEQDYVVRRPQKLVLETTVSESASTVSKRPRLEEQCMPEKELPPS